MKAAEHFAEAERILDAAANAPADVNIISNLLAAQVHATLAVAASQLRSLPAEQEATQS